MRAIVIGCVIASLPGCFGRQQIPAQWVLIIDDAELAPSDHDGNRWCVDGSAPSVAATVRFGGEEATTPPVQSATPAWAAPTLIASEGAWARGVFVDVRGQCDEREFRIGAAIVHPAPAAIERGGFALANIGGLRALRIHFARWSGGASEAAPADWYPYDVAAGAYVDGVDSGWPVYDDGTDGWDDGSGDVAVGDGTTGDGSGDDPTGDNGGDPSGDPGGDGGGDSGGGDGESKIGRGGHRGLMRPSRGLQTHSQSSSPSRSSTR
jgi:hypothetical protein